MRISSLFLFSCILGGLLSCSQDQDSTRSTNESKKILIEKISDIKGGNQKGMFALYDVLTPERIFKNVVLSNQDILLYNSTRAAGEVTQHTAYGYDSYDFRSKTYQLYIRNQASSCGVPDGTYVVQDIWLYKSVQAPAPVGVAFANNNYENYSKMGYDPSALNQPGLTCSMNSNTGRINLQTGAIMVISNMIGQKINMTVPVRASNLEWHYYFMPLQ